MEKMKFEKALEKLEKIVALLEEGNIPLDEALSQYEEGIKLSRLCANRLAEVEKKVELLSKKADGTFTTEPFDEETENSSEKRTNEKTSRKKTARKKTEHEDSKDLLFP